jgi:tRNA pseudouridine55 synthase
MRNCGTDTRGKGLDGILVVDKPEGLTSHDVVDRVREISGLQKIGHTGTLDPFATGVLVLCIQRATKIAGFLSALDKEYEGEMTLGTVSSTYDVQGEKKLVAQEIRVDRTRIEKEIDKFRGEILQTPPLYSAVKLKGKKLYQYAREGKEVRPKPRRVTVYEFKIVSFKLPLLRFRTRVSSGTYVRSLCHELGQALGCGAYCSALRRTRVGHFSLPDAVTLIQLEAKPKCLHDHLIKISHGLQHLPSLRIKPASLKKVSTGQSLTSNDLVSAEGELLPRQPVTIRDGNNQVLAVYEVTGEMQDRSTEGGLLLHPLRVLLAE